MLSVYLSSSFWSIGPALATPGNAVGLMLFEDAEFLWGASTPHLLLMKPSPPWDEQSSSPWLS